MLKTIKHLFFPDLSAYGAEPGMGLLEPKPEVLGRELLAKAKPHHRKAVELALCDLYGRRAEAILRLPRAWETAIATRVLADPRDLPIALTFLQCTLWLCFSLALQLTVTWGVLGQRFVLAMHYGAHRSLISPKLPFAATLNHLPQLLLANFWGMPSGMYYLHHCVMHHQANNLFPWDLSGTNRYQRDSLLGLFHYITNFCLHTFLYLPYYAVAKRRFGLAALSMCSMGVYFAALYYLHQLHPSAFWINLGVASAFGPIMLMAGNFGQHQFVDPKDVTSNYGLTINMIKAPFNMLTFNDGYHIVHLQLALIFHTLDYTEMSALIYSGQLEKLAGYCVQLRAKERTVAELVAVFKERLKPMPEASEPLDLPKKLIFGLQQLLWLGLYAAGMPSAAFPAMLVPFFAIVSFYVPATA